MRPVGVVVLKRPLSGDEVPAHQLGEVARKGPQFLADFLVELVRGDVERDIGQLLALGSLVLPVGPAVPGTGARGTGALPAVIARERAAGTTLTPGTALALTTVAITAATTRASIALASAAVAALSARAPVVTESTLATVPVPALAPIAVAALTTRAPVVTESTLAARATIAVAALATRTTITVAAFPTRAAVVA
ncbi:hypothetical protein [Nonomuraea sp. B19D2]|uniref:hypothetical protein n=1 Tax=Nonomuraea sp. B19D2 TaxID=3159561 RepID=UPI0032DB45ED